MEVRHTFWKRRAVRYPGVVQLVLDDKDGLAEKNGSANVLTATEYPTLVCERSSPRDYSSYTRAISKVSTKLTTAKSALLNRRRASSNLPPIKAFAEFLEETEGDWNDSEPIEQSQQTPTAMSPTIQTPQVIKTPTIPTIPTSKSITETDDTIVKKESIVMTRLRRFRLALQDENIDLAHLRKLSWSGVPLPVRATTWQILLGYQPANLNRRAETLRKKRAEYDDAINATFTHGEAGLDQVLRHQIHIDILRTNAGVPLYQSEETQQCLERILYCWSIRHPASGYVQGINDLVTPFFQVFLQDHIDGNVQNYDITQLPKDVLRTVEADAFWCLSKLLDGIQDNYTYAQPGIQRQIIKMKELVARIDAPLASHLDAEHVDYIAFAWRWMNCLLMRELPLETIIRMWDTYLAEGSDGFSDFHVYVCAAFLVKWSEKLRKMDFQNIIMFLQQLPTDDWTEKDVELLLSEAFMWKSLFHAAPKHLGT